MINKDTASLDWQQRAWFLTLLGAIIGILIHFLIDTGNGFPRITDDSIRLAAATLLSVAGIAFGFVVERITIRLSAIFACIAGCVVASTVYWDGPFGSHQVSEPWRIVCALLTIAIAAPLFQAWLDGKVDQFGGSWHIPYINAHNRAWTNVVLWFAAWVFVGIVWALAFLLSELFDLISLHFLHDLLQKDWFDRTLTGAALGGAIGLLRDREKILGLLQRVVTTVLSVLAPVLAIGLIVFLVALPFTGLTPLWQATKSTTPILISCVIGALSLTNAVIGDADEDETKNKILRWSAMALSAVMLPLGIVATVSTGLRIHQYGLTPSRLWAVVFAAIACAYGLAYLVSLIRGRIQWASLLRPANLILAEALCGLAFLLSTPLISFGALSTHDQVARLLSGQIPASKFDWAAMRFDFGPSGVSALNALAATGATSDIRKMAASTLKQDNQFEAQYAQAAATADGRITILPVNIALPDALHQRITEYDACGDNGACVVIYRSGANEAIIVHGESSNVWQLKDGQWNQNYEAFEINKNDKAVVDAGLAKHDVEIRNVTQRQVFVGGRPVGMPFK